MNPKLSNLKALTERENLLLLLREAEPFSDSVLTAMGYLLYTLTKEQESKRKEKP